MSDSAQWLAALQAGDPDSRIDALGRLDALPEQERLAPLVATLGDPEWRVRKSASSRLKTFAVTPDLLDALLSAVVQNGDPWLRTAAMEVIISHGARSGAGPVVAFLLDALVRVDLEPRKFVAELLGQMGDPRGVEPLIDQLRADDENLQLSVLDALARIGDRAALPAVIERLEQGSGQVQFAALTALQLLADPAAVPAVVRAVERRPLRQLAMETLGQIGDTQAAAPLWKWWTSGSGQERDGALLAMTKIADRLSERERPELAAAVRQWHRPAHTVELLARLETAEPHLQQAAIVVAGWLREPALLMPLVNLLGGDLAPHAKEALAAMAADHAGALLELLPRATPTIYRALIELLSGTADPRVAPAMRTALNSPEGRVRRTAALGLAACRDRESAPLLVGLLSDPDPEVQEAALAALGACRDPQVVPAVIRLLSDESPAVRRNGARALGLLEAGECSAPLALALHDPDASVRTAAIVALSLIGHAHGSTALTEQLLLALGDDAPQVRLTAARALESRVESVPVEWWACLLEDPDQWVRAMAARLAGRSRDTQAALVLQRCLQDESGAVQIAALEVIGRRPEPSCVEAVRALLQSPDADVVSAALATAVAMLGRGAPSPAHQEWAAMMTRCLDHPSWAVRVAALQALASVSPAEARQQAGLLAGRDAHARVREAASRLSGEGS